MDRAGVGEPGTVVCNLGGGLGEFIAFSEGNLVNHPQVRTNLYPVTPPPRPTAAVYLGKAAVTFRSRHSVHGEQLLVHWSNEKGMAGSRTFCRRATVEVVILC